MCVFWWNPSSRTLTLPVERPLSFYLWVFLAAPSKPQTQRAAPRQTPSQVIFSSHRPLPLSIKFTTRRSAMSHSTRISERVARLQLCSSTGSPILVSYATRKKIRSEIFTPLNVKKQAQLPDPFPAQMHPRYLSTFVLSPVSHTEGSERHKKHKKTEQLASARVRVSLIDRKEAARKQARRKPKQGRCSTPPVVRSSKRLSVHKRNTKAPRCCSSRSRRAMSSIRSTRTSMTSKNPEPISCKVH